MYWKSTWNEPEEISQILEQICGKNGYYYILVFIFIIHYLITMIIIIYLKKNQLNQSFATFLFVPWHSIQAGYEWDHRPLYIPQAPSSSPSPSPGRYTHTHLPIIRSVFVSIPSKILLCRWQLLSIQSLSLVSAPLDLPRPSASYIPGGKSFPPRALCPSVVYDPLQVR